MHHDSRIMSSAEHVAAGAARLRASLESLSDQAATQARGDGWTPAQIVFHVGLTNERFFLPAFEGSAPFVAQAPDGFTETFSFETIPPKIKTFPHLEPPAASKAEALQKLDATTERLVEAMRTLPAERMAHCATLPFGTLSMRQMAEFAAGHVARHEAQLGRALAPGV